MSWTVSVVQRVLIAVLWLSAQTACSYHAPRGRRERVPGRPGLGARHVHGRPAAQADGADAPDPRLAAQVRPRADLLVSGLSATTNDFSLSFLFGRFGASSRSYTFKAFDSREQIAEIVRAQVGLEEDELALNHNTLLNRAISYRIELSPRMQNPDEPMPYPSQYHHHQEPQQQQQPEHQGHQRRSSTDDLSLSFEGAFRPDEPARKRSRGESGNSQGSSDNSMGDAPSLLVPVFDDEDIDAVDDEAAQTVAKHVHFTTQPPVEIPPASPPCVEAPELAAAPWGIAIDTGSSSASGSSAGENALMLQSAAASAAPSGSHALGLGGLATLTIPLTGSPQDAR